MSSIVRVLSVLRGPFRSVLVDSAPYRCVHSLVINSKTRLLREFNAYLNLKTSSPRDPGRVYQLMQQCVVGLRMEVPKERVALADKMWSSLKEKGGTKMDVSLHNALLRVYVSNNHQFSPSQFMEEMTKTGIFPNQSTLSLLLDSHCQQGNLAGAQSMLQYMHGKGHHVTEQVYASLISGHAQSGDMDGAWKMLDVMKENGFDPSIASYTALLRGHAQQGEIDQVKETLKKMTAKKIYPSHDVYIAVLDSLSMGGHHRFISGVFDMIPSKPLILSDMLQLVQSWASRGEYECSMQLLEMVCLLSRQEQLDRTRVLEASEVVFHHMTYSKHPFSWLLENLDRMTVMGCAGRKSWEKLLLQLYLSGDSVRILSTVKEMHGKGFVVKQHYLFPAIAQYANTRNISGVKECLCVLKELELSIDYTAVQFIRHAVGSGESSTLLTLMKESGFFKTKEDRRNFIDHLCAQDLPTLLDVVKEIGVGAVGIEFLCQCLVGHCRKQRPDTTGLARVFKMLQSSSSVPSDVLTKYVEKCAAELFYEGSMDGVVNFVTALIHQGVSQLTDDTYSYALSAASDNTKFRSLLEQQSIPLDRLKVMEHGVDKEDLNAAIINLWHSSEHKKHSKVLEVYSTMQAKGVIPNSISAPYIVSSMTAHGDIAAAESLLHELQKKGHLISRYTWNCFMFYYSKLGDVDNVKIYYERLLSAGIKPDQFTLWCLMGAYSYHGDVHMVRNVMNVDRVKHNVRVTNGMVSQLMQALVKSNDLNESVVVYEESLLQPAAGVVINLLDTLVEREEHELLERVKKTTQLKYPTMFDFDHSLMLSYLRCAKFEKAVEVASRKDFKMNLRIIRRFCSARAAEGKVESIRSIMQLFTRVGLSTDPLYLHLLKAYISLEDKDGIESLQTEMSDSGVTLARKFTSVLNTYLNASTTTTTTKPSSPPPPSPSPHSIEVDTNRLEQ